MTMKKIFPWLIASAAILLALPWLAVTFVKSDAGMAVSLFLFFVLNPIYAICAGAYAGRDVKRFWALPVITALFFLAGAWWFFELGESDFHPVCTGLSDFRNGSDAPFPVRQEKAAEKT